MKNLVNLREKPSAKRPLLSSRPGSGPVVASSSPAGGIVSRLVTCPGLAPRSAPAFGNGTGGGTIGKGGGQPRQRTAGKTPSLAWRPARWHLGECVIAFAGCVGGRRLATRRQRYGESGTRAGQRAARQADTEGEEKGRAAPSRVPGVCRRTDALPAPSPRRPRVVPPQPRLTSPLLGAVGGRGAPDALPSLLPPPPPTPGRAATICGYSFTRQKKKKKVCRMSHTEKKKNPKPSEKNLRVGLADGIIKASPEPWLALPLRQPPGEEPRPAGPAPSPMDLRAGDSWGMLACLCTVLWHLPAVPALNRTGDPGPGPSIQKTYDLTRYLEHQLRSLAGTYLNYLGPPFNEPDFNPPRLGAETLPRATVNLEVWRSLNDKLRLTQNYEAYSHLLCHLRGLNRQAAAAELRRSLAHFCTSLQGLLGSIAGVMAALGYPLPQPLPGTEPTWAPGPAHSDFLQKMDDFWLLKELQTWLWRSAKDFNRLKKKMQPPAAAVTLHLEARGF